MDNISNFLEFKLSKMGSNKTLMNISITDENIKQAP